MKSNQKGEQVAFRLSAELLRRCDALRGRLVPGVELSRSDVIRAALARGLEALEAALPPPSEGDAKSD